MAFAILQYFIIVMQIKLVVVVVVVVVNALINSKVQHPPRVTPRAFELLKIGLFNSLPSGQKSRSNAPPISTELPLLKDKFPLQSNTLHAF